MNLSAGHESPHTAPMESLYTWKQKVSCFGRVHYLEHILEAHHLARQRIGFSLFRGRTWELEMIIEPKEKDASGLEAIVDG
ncbi:hypothetical protein Ahy_B06g082561 isoform B [Arachis hypogaea]|uniref:Uncharacterized protein n=1 Tax=Arachis hypogaea TaxID=3818 RepID=A0A444YNH5_ARAHY|nr:hypothetical protein Ahy_B06g082561 isoform B [Arachis hypogaea]